MSDIIDRLNAVLRDRYQLDAELGSVGMACQADRYFETGTAVLRSPAQQGVSKGGALLRTRRAGGPPGSYYA
jgi:hypothetical protein